MILLSQAKRKKKTTTAESFKIRIRRQKVLNCSPTSPAWYLCYHILNIHQSRLLRNVYVCLQRESSHYILVTYIDLFEDFIEEILGVFLIVQLHSSDISALFRDPMFVDLFLKGMLVAINLVELSLVISIRTL